MSYQNHRRITFSGIFGTTTSPYERWSFRLNTRPFGTTPKPLSQAQACADAFLTHLSTVISSNVKLTEVKLANIIPDVGDRVKYFDEPTVLSLTPSTTTAGTIKWPSQVAVAISLDTALRGPGGRGRFYLPGPSGDLDPTSGAMTAATAQGTAVQAAAFINALNAIVDLPSIAILSRKGTEAPVTSVRCGRVYDTIRSRRTSNLELYGADVVVSG